jgi:hypothetical protein
MGEGRRQCPTMDDAFVNVRPIIVRQPLRDKHTLLTPASHLSVVALAKEEARHAPHAPVHGAFGLPDVASRLARRSVLECQTTGRSREFGRRGEVWRSRAFDGVGD